MAAIEIKSKLDSGEFDDILGLMEDEELDVKDRIYPIENILGKHELAKDVCSFLNRSGGIIILGVRTSDDQTSFGRTLQELRLFEERLFNPTDYHNILSQWIYPGPQQIEMRWCASKKDPSRGIAYVFIPPQPNALRPFLVTKTVDPSNLNKLKEILFGYAERKSHSSEPASLQTIHALLRAGRDNAKFEDILSRIDSLESSLLKAPEQSERRKGLDGLITSRLTICSKAASLLQKPTYSLLVIPVDITEVSSIFQSGSSSVVQAMDKPRLLRFGGWGLDTQDRSTIVGGKLRRAKLDGEKCVDLHRDGTLVFVCSADSAFLSWGSPSQSVQLNPLAIIETTYLFFDLWSIILRDLTPLPKTIRINWSLSRMHGEGGAITLSPYGVESARYRLGFGQKSAPTESSASCFDLDTAGFSAPAISLRVVSELYSWFGLESDKIPYVNPAKDGIDEDQLANPRRQ